MEHIEKISAGPLGQLVEGANNICLEPIRCHWDGTLFNGHRENLNLNSHDIDDLRFKLGFDHVELVQSTMVEKQSIQLVSCTGNLKTLSVTFVFKLSDTMINGKIRICSVLDQSLDSTYKLHLTNVKIKSVVGLYIEEDSYRIGHIIHEFLDARISLLYKSGSRMIPVYDKVQDKSIKHSLVQYIINNTTKNSTTLIESKLKSAFDLMSVSISLRNDFSQRDIFRIHTKNMKVAFNNLVDEIIDATNLLLIQTVPKVSLPNISVILNFKKVEKKCFQAFRNSLKGFNFLLRRKSCIVSMEKDLIVLYVPVDFADLNIRFRQFIIKHGEVESKSSDIEEHYKTEGSYLTISIKKLEENKFDLNLLEFKIDKFIFLDTDNQTVIDPSVRLWINSTLEFKVVPLIEEMFEKYIRLIITTDKFTKMNI
ncbi:uncharacterized protein LOC100113862 isoform X1 [Nasonia vitripennis]|uniref:Uncharacterized protein n=2 Tax=Nasonia vitripennis TaxID=7425 RepID=A0A7M7G5N0_NASVI|nr:uncharacterized protein LOC100113862 isoform X1 [Nasonia vitripennis]